MGWSSFRDAETRARWREHLLQKQNGRCALCGHRFPEPGAFHPSVYAGFAPSFDHIVPKSKGGEDELHNLQLVHQACNHLKGDGDGLKRLPPLPGTLTRPAGSMPRRLRLNAEGEMWCRRHGSWKRVYSSLEEAWIAVFVEFVRTNRITTPYRCGRSVRTTSTPRSRVRTNPWAYDPVVHWVGSKTSRTTGCQYWHITIQTWHIIAAAKLAALPKAPGWESYHHATDGAWVRRDRECVRRDGLPKKRFVSLEEAERIAAAKSVRDGRRGRRYHAYRCSQGHIHVGRRLE